MINILNHNTSYKHSKFSARPAYVYTSLKWDHETIVSKAGKQVADNTMVQKKARSLSITDKQSISVLKEPLGYSNTAAGIRTATIAKTNINGRPVYRQSKELLCWRHDLAFFNLQGFFLSILKALHVCWSFAKNNKTIVFVSTDSPSDTGASAATDMLTQRFAREFLPRIQTIVTPLTLAQKDYSKLRHAPKTKAFTAEKRRANQTKDQGRRLSESRAARDVFSKIANSNNGEQSHSRRPVDLTDQCQSESDVEQGQAGAAVRKVPVLSELKNLINISGLFKRQYKPNASFDNLFMTNPAYHKLDGLLYKAASRRLSASFSRVHASFFSNTKNSFREKFTHLSNHYPQNHDSLKILEGSKRLFALDLNKSCLVKPTGETLTRAQDQKTWSKQLTIGESDPIFSFRTIKKSEKKNYGTSQGSSRPLRTDVPLGLPFSKPLAYDLIPTNHAGGQRGVAGSVQATTAVCKKRRQIVRKLPCFAGTFSHKSLHTYTFSSKYRAQRANIIFTNESFKSNIKNKNARSMVGALSFSAAGKKHKSSKREYHNRFFKPFRSYDYYSMFIHAQAYNETKRFAYNPYLRHADLVFFVNPDKNPGLAEQVKKLAIPSIGIVSGLKSTSYRKQPYQANLHDSVTYPIVGNPDNLIFVMMIVRVFATLIQNVSHNKSKPQGTNGRRISERVALKRA